MKYVSIWLLVPKKMCKYKTCTIENVRGQTSWFVTFMWKKAAIDVFRSIGTDYITTFWFWKGEISPFKNSLPLKMLKINNLSSTALMFCIIRKVTWNFTNTCIFFPAGFAHKVLEQYCIHILPELLKKPTNTVSLVSNINRSQSGSKHMYQPIVSKICYNCHYKNYWGHQIPLLIAFVKTCIIIIINHFPHKKNILYSIYYIALSAKNNNNNNNATQYKLILNIKYYPNDHPSVIFLFLLLTAVINILCFSILIAGLNRFTSTLITVDLPDTTAGDMRGWTEGRPVPSRPLTPLLPLPLYSLVGAARASPAQNVPPFPPPPLHSHPPPAPHLPTPSYPVRHLRYAFRWLWLNIF